MKKVPLIALLAPLSLSLVSCYHGTYVPKPPSGLYERVLASQDVSSLTSSGGLVIVNGQLDVLALISPISAGSAPGLMAISPTRATVLAFDAGSNRVSVVNTKTESSAGSIQLAGATTSMVVPSTDTFAYAAVPTAPLNGVPTGAVQIMNLTNGSVALTVSVPNAQTVISNPNGTQLLAFSNDSDAVTIITPSLAQNNTTATTITVPGFDRPVYGFFSTDGSKAYILNCGAQCAGTQAGVQILNLGATPSAGASVPVDGATMGLISGSTLYVAGTSPTNNACTGEKTAATICGRLDLVDLGSMTVTGSAVITNGYHTVMSISANGQLFIGASDCITIGNVNAPQGEVRGCLSIYNTTNGEVVIPPDNGDVTDLQSFTSRYVEYVAEGGNLRVYDTTQDALLVNEFINGTIAIVGQVVNVKAIDFF
ncbi:MAG: hypothetical protein WB510_20175 [Candidatus Sulfotelmatobacter sp.]